MKSFYETWKLYEAANNPLQSLTAIPALLDQLEQLLAQIGSPNPQPTDQQRLRTAGNVFKSVAVPQAVESLDNILAFVENINDPNDPNAKLVGFIKNIIDQLRGHYTVVHQYVADIGKSMKSMQKKLQNNITKHVGQEVGTQLRSAMVAMKDLPWDDIYYAFSNLLLAIRNGGFPDVGMPHWMKIYPGQQGTGARGEAINPYDEAGWKKYMGDEIKRGNTQWRAQLNKSYLLSSPSYSDKDSVFFDITNPKSIEAATDWIANNGSAAFSKLIERNPEAYKQVVRQFKKSQPPSVLPTGE